MHRTPALMVFVFFLAGVGWASGVLAIAPPQAKLPDVSGIPEKNPVLYSKESIAKGRIAYGPKCQECHDQDGRALSGMFANAADLTKPGNWKYGTSDAHLFRTIRDGAGGSMPGWKAGCIGPESYRSPAAARGLSLA